MSAHLIPWQEKLREQCRALHWPPPIYKEYSDRRGGRTAWSCSVHIGPHMFVRATFWYDAKQMETAKHDAALNMLQQLQLEKGTPQSHALQQQQYQHQQAIQSDRW